MKIRVKTFAQVSDIIGKEGEVLDFQGEASLETLKSSLIQRYPKLADLWSSLAIAVNGQIVDNNVSFKEDDEVVLIPPVSGG